jgi:hypothetical protein
LSARFSGFLFAALCVLVLVGTLLPASWCTVLGFVTLVVVLLAAIEKNQLE